MSLERLNSTKASGSDGIPPVILKSLSAELSTSLADLFNESLDAATVPSLYKLANVTPYFESRVIHAVLVTTGPSACYL